ncbi:MAG: DNA packaging protein [Actinobacteria bacterium]|nr:DNA packaging protein [Actinomycetota bacterium]
MSNLKITVADIQAELERRKYNKIETYFPDIGPLRRELYVKHMEFFEAGKQHKERTMMSANRVGKTESGGGYEVVCHATGRYPDWWPGVKLSKPPNILIGGETGKLVRDSIQLKLLGQLYDKGTGLIPRDCIKDVTPKSGIPKAVDEIFIKHTNGTSVIQFQSYDQGREVFQSTERDIVWFDEEPPEDIYAEGLTRTMTTRGMVISTFTPLKGVTQTVLGLQKKASEGIGKIITLTWDDAPHLSEEDKEALWKSLPPHQRDARSKGIPALGSGAIYPVAESDFVIEPFEIPEHFKRCYGFDVGWNNTAAVWLAYDADSDTAYVTHDYKRGQLEPSVHAASIRARGNWIPGAIDPASRGRTQNDGEQLIWLYRQQGLELVEADNGVESGLFDVYERLTTNRLKVFSTCVQTLEEYRLYRRDDKGRVVKENDHLMDAMRYGIKTGLRIARSSPIKKKTLLKMPSAAGSYMGN